MRAASTVIAIDLGAESGRVITARLDGQRVSMEISHRFSNGPVRVQNRLHWDILHLWSEIQSSNRRTQQPQARLARGRYLGSRFWLARPSGRVCWETPCTTEMRVQKACSSGHFKKCLAMRFSLQRVYSSCRSILFTSYSVWWKLTILNWMLRILF